MLCAAAESFAEKIEEMLLRWEEAAVTGELKETPEKLLSRSLASRENWLAQRRSSRKKN